MGGRDYQIVIRQGETALCHNALRFWRLWSPARVDRAARLSWRADRQQLCQLRAMLPHRCPDRIAQARDHVIGMACGIEQRPFPVGMSRFGNDVAQWNSRLLENA